MAEIPEEGEERQEMLRENQQTPGDAGGAQGLHIAALSWDRFSFEDDTVGRLSLS